MKKGNIVKLQNGQNVIITKIKNDIIVVKKAVKNIGDYKDCFGEWQGVGKEFEISRDQIQGA